MLTKSEKEVMELLWTVDEPLTCLQIVARSENKTWKDSYVHIITSSLMNKGMIKVGDLVRRSRNYARAFSPAISREEYAIQQVVEDTPWESKKLPELFTAFVENQAEEETIEQMYKAIQKRRNELRGDK